MYRTYDPPPKYITANDPPLMQEIERRWRSCSDQARQFAGRNAGRYFGILPHIIAESYDLGQIDWLEESRASKQ